MNDSKMKLLQEPFAPDDLEWRVQQQGVSNSGKPWVMVFAYVTNRAIQQRFDDVLGYDGWQNEYRPSPDGCGVICGISIKCGDNWITKWDGAEKKATNDHVDETKSALSNSMKRAAVQWGPGRYLYDLETVFAICHAVDSRKDCIHNYSYHKKSNTHIEWMTPEIPEWALPNVEADQYIENMQQCEDINSLQLSFKEAYLHAKAFNRSDLKDKFKEVYDAEVERLDEEAKVSIEKNYKEIESWVSRQVKTLDFIPDVSSVERVCSTFRDHVKRVSQNQYYDTQPLYDSINSSEKNRIDEIKKQEQEND